MFVFFGGDAFDFIQIAKVNAAKNHPEVAVYSLIQPFYTLKEKPRSLAELQILVYVANQEWN